MLEEKLELLIITYNRAAYLERTLAQLLASPFAGCRLTVLDNCSTDETAQVCAQYRDKFAQMRVVRHQKNIGACANYLRAVELSSSAYTWVLCDDDLFDFSDCRELIAAVEAEQYDLISLGYTGRLVAEQEKLLAHANALEKASYFIFISSFVPSLIFKTKLFDSECLARGYRNAINLYPHFEFLKKCVENNFSVYTLKTQIVRRGDEKNALSALQWFTFWVNSCNTISDRKLRRLTIYRATESRFDAALLWRLANWIVAEKMLHPKRIYQEMIQLSLGLSADQLLALSVVSPLAVLPSSLYKTAWALKRRLRGATPAPTDETCDLFRL